MTPEEFKDIRINKLGLTQSELAKALRYSGDNGKRTIQRYEAGDRSISGPVTLALEYLIVLAEQKPR